MKSNPSRPGTPARPAPSRPPAGRSTTPASAQRAANAARTQVFVRGVIQEMKRVTWPSREEWVAATLLTIALVVGVGLFTSACDWIFEHLFTLITGSAR